MDNLLLVIWLRTLSTNVVLLCSPRFQPLHSKSEHQENHDLLGNCPITAPTYQYIHNLCLNRTWGFYPSLSSPHNMFPHILRGLGPSFSSPHNMFPHNLGGLAHAQALPICRHRILYSLWLGPSFPNDGKILKPKVGLKPDQIINWLEEGFYEKYNSLMNKIMLFLENKCHGNPKVAYVYTHIRTQIWCMRMHIRACIRS